MSSQTSNGLRVTVASAGDQLVAHVYRAGGDQARPAVLLCTGFSGTQDTPSLVAAARAFAGAGCLAVTFDYRGFGESGGEPRQVVSVPGQLDDIRAMVAYLRSREDVDAERVALWGSSLGGGHVVTIAAEDARIAAVVAQMPFNGFPRKVEGRTARETVRLLWAVVRDSLRGRLGRRPLYIKALGAPHELAVMASRDAARTIAGMTSRTWRNEVAPRGLFDMMRYHPGRMVDRIAAPLLVCISELDRETIGALTEPLARDAPRGELRRYPIAHFDIYRPDIREQVLRDQVAFLRASLGLPTPGRRLTGVGARRRGAPGCAAGVSRPGWW